MIADSPSPAQTELPDNISEAAAPRPRPQDDLYRFVSGPWLGTHTIPQDRPVDGTFHHLHDRAERDVRAIVEAASTDTRMGALFRSFMDADAINAARFSLLEPDFALLRVTTFPALATAFGQLDRSGVSTLAGFYVAKDAAPAGADGSVSTHCATTGEPSDATTEPDTADPAAPTASGLDIAYINQGGLSLPDEAYYRLDQHAPIREKFLEHVAAMFRLLLADVEAGVLANPLPEAFAGATSEELAAHILAFETKIAAGHWDVEASRDALKTYNPTTVSALPTGFPWAEFFRECGVDGNVVVSQPSYLEHVATLAAEEPLEMFQLWAVWHVVAVRSGLLAEDIGEERFNFTGRVLAGSEKQRARWKRGLGLVQQLVPDDVGRAFVAEHFLPEHKEVMDELVAYLLRAYHDRIAHLPWMTPATRERALGKLATLRAKIGYPNEWRNYDDLTFSPHGADVVENFRAGARHAHEEVVGKIGKPTNRDEWVAPAQMVNAFYNPVVNDITFPAAILRPPFFTPDADMAQNFGAIGAVIGHEIGHAFDDQGSRFDAEGNLNSWWEDDDRAAFEALTSKLVAQFDGLTPTGLTQRAPKDGSAELPGVNGAFTLGENIGDLGGLGIAVVAYSLYLQDRGLTPDTAPQQPFIVGEDGNALTDYDAGDTLEVPVDEAHHFTALQRLFLSWSAVWRTAIRPQLSAQYLAVDPHSPAEFRCNVIVRNIAEFAEAFNIQPGDGMWLAPEERVTIW